MKTAAELACIKAEVEYQEWRECPQWYCVKTTYHNTGEIESEIMCEEKTNIPIAIQSDKKPNDGVFETMSATIYYTYHRGYKEAAKQVELAKEMMAVAI